MYFNRVCETLKDVHIGYENGRVTTFCSSKDATFEQY